MYDLRKKIIFTHPQKCGGTSIEHILGFLEVKEDRAGIIGLKHGTLKAHIDTLVEKQINIDDFFKFSIIRNPWDRVVSFYNHCKYREHIHFIKHPTPGKQIPQYVEDARNMTFKEYAYKYCTKNFNSNKRTKPFMFFNGEFFLDYVIRLEHLKEDFQKIQDKLQIELKCEIPHKHNADEFLERKPYSEYYDEETKNVVEQAFEWDIKAFGYAFK